jgi:hypothetical protein
MTQNNWDLEGQVIANTLRHLAFKNYYSLILDTLNYHNPLTYKIKYHGSIEIWMK